MNFTTGDAYVALKEYGSKGVPFLAGLFRKNASPRNFASSMLKEMSADATPILIPMLDTEEHKAQAYDALRIVTEQDFGYDPKTWQTWWDSQQQRDVQ